MRHRHTRAVPSRALQRRARRQRASYEQSGQELLLAPRKHSCILGWMQERAARRQQLWRDVLTGLVQEKRSPAEQSYLCCESEGVGGEIPSPLWGKILLRV